MHAPSTYNLRSRFVHAITGASVVLALVLVGSYAIAQPTPPVQHIPSVTITATANPNPVEKSYRKMIKGMDLFERQRNIAPQAVLRWNSFARCRLRECMLFCIFGGHEWCECRLVFCSSLDLSWFASTGRARRHQTAA